MKILMLNLPFSGHTNPTLPLTAELVKKGHEVTYINAEDFRSPIEAAGAHFVPYADYPDHPTEQEKKKLCFTALFNTAMKLEEKFDLLIYEMFFYPGVDVAKAKGIPCVRQFSQPAWCEKTWKDAPLVFRTSAKMIDAQVLPKRTVRSLGLTYGCLRDGIILSRPDLNIVYVPDSFQYCREDFGDDYLFKIPDAKSGPSDNGIRIPYEEMRKPVLYISLGSIISNRGFCRECIRAFGNTEFSVILNTGKVDAGSLGEIPGNIRAYSFVPQLEVLDHTDVFLTHCGMNSVNEALTRGVPMVAMPFINDQITNGKQIESLGLGKRVRSFPSRGKELLAAARYVYASDEIKQNVRRMQDRIRNQMSWDEIICRIENTAASRQ